MSDCLFRCCRPSPHHVTTCNDISPSSIQCHRPPFPAKEALTMDVPRGSRRARHAASAASSQEASLQAQAQLELEAATQHRRTRRQALQVQVTPDASIAVAAGVHVHQAPEFGHRRREMEPPPNPFRLHRCELFNIYLMLLVFISSVGGYKASVVACILIHEDYIIKGGRMMHPLINVGLVSGWLLIQFGVTCESLFFSLLPTSFCLCNSFFQWPFFIPPRLL